MKKSEDIEVQRSEVRESKTRQIAVIGTKMMEERKRERRRVSFEKLRSRFTSQVSLIIFLQVAQQPFFISYRVSLWFLVM